MGTNRLVRPEEYLARHAKLLSGETFEMIMNYNLEEPEVAERIELAHSKAQEQGKVIKSDYQEALLRGAQAFQGEIFEMYANALMSDPK